MEKITYGKMVENFMEHNRAQGMGVGDQFDKRGIEAVIVFSASNWKNKSFTEEERSYKVVSTNKAWLDGMIGNSIFADCLDGKDRGVRLDWYDWEVEYCYML